MQTRHFIKKFTFIDDQDNGALIDNGLKEIEADLKEQGKQDIEVKILSYFFQPLNCFTIFFITYLATFKD